MLRLGGGAVHPSICLGLLVILFEAAVELLAGRPAGATINPTEVASGELVVYRRSYFGFPVFGAGSLAYMGVLRATFRLAHHAGNSRLQNRLADRPPSRRSNLGDDVKQQFSAEPR